MLLEALALALYPEHGVPTAAHAHAPPASVQRLAQAAAERGPIRRHLEAAEASPIVEAASDRLGLSVREARSQVRSAPPAANTNVWRALALLAIVLAVGLAVFLSRVE